MKFVWMGLLAWFVVSLVCAPIVGRFLAIGNARHNNGRASQE